MSQPDWIEDLKSGTPAARRERAFRALLSEWHVPVYRFVRRMVLRHDDADDITQETLIQVARAIDGFRGESAFSTWLFTIANRKALDHLKAQQRKRRLFRSEALRFEDHMAELEADSWFDGDEAERRLHAGLACLPPRQKQIFLLRYFEEMPYAEIAQITKRSEGALKASYHHATKKLKHFLQAAD